VYIYIYIYDDGCVAGGAAARSAVPRTHPPLQRRAYGFQFFTIRDFLWSCRPHAADVRGYSDADTLVCCSLAFSLALTAVLMRPCVTCCRRWCILQLTDAAQVVQQHVVLCRAPIRLSNPDILHCTCAVRSRAMQRAAMTNLST